ncbi:MAG: integrase arm-type DNA-binding domain-containing protein [Pseudomonadota bacterium]
MATDNRVNFTAARVRDYACPPGKAEAMLWDTAAPGLGLRVRSGGAKSYIFQFKIHGKAARITIGSPEAWGIDQARAEARRLKVLVDQGTDPREDMRAKAEAHAAKQAETARKAVTVGDLWHDYIEARKSGWGAHSIKDHQRAMQAPGVKIGDKGRETKAGGLYALHDVRLADLTPERIEAWLRAESATRPTTTARNYRLLRGFIRWAATLPDFKGAMHADAYKAPNVTRAKPRVKAKADALEREQLKLWFDEVRKINNPVIAAYLQALLLTGARPGELIAVEWSDVDFQWQRLTIRDKDSSKGGLEGVRTIPLTPYVAALLARLPRINAYVFGSRQSVRGYIAEPGDPHRAAVARAGLPHLTLHGLRRSFGTLSEWVEVPAGIVAQIQGHKPSATAEKHYRVRPLDLLRMWHTKIEGWMLEQAGIEQPAADEAAPQVMRRVK